MATSPTSPPANADSAGAKNCAPQSVPESELAQTLGVAREDLKKLRAQNLAFAVDWTGGRGDPILITPAGQAKLQAALGAGDGTVQGAIGQLRAPDRYTALAVVRIGGARVVLARRPDAVPEAPLERVLVRSSVNFMAGMLMKQCQASRTPGVWYFHGRSPRQKGRF